MNPGIPAMSLEVAPELRQQRQTPVWNCEMRLGLPLLATLTLSIAAISPAFAACDISPRVNTPEAIAGDLQRSGCRSGDIATVTGLPADAAAALVRRVCAFNQQIVVIPREPRPPATIIDLLCVYSPR
jgi:hypothetical protein